MNNAYEEDDRVKTSYCPRFASVNNTYSVFTLRLQWCHIGHYFVLLPSTPCIIHILATMMFSWTTACELIGLCVLPWILIAWVWSYCVEGKPGRHSDEDFNSTMCLVVLLHGLGLAGSKRRLVGPLRTYAVALFRQIGSVSHISPRSIFDRGL